MSVLTSLPVNIYLFRGQQDATWGLQPSIERLPKRGMIGLDEAEQVALRAFVRRSHHYIENPPEQDNTLEWLALMQHYGAPTRLLDWTASPYVAAFFAAAGAKEDATSAIWAINYHMLLAEAGRLLHEAYPENPEFEWTGSFSSYRGADLFTRSLRLDQPAFVVPVRPFRFNDRMARQQGWFLCANSLKAPFESTLTRVVQRASEYARQNRIAPLMKMTLRGHAGTLLELTRMNITYETMFPGLEGFARSLETQLKIRTVAHTRDVEDWL